MADLAFEDDVEQLSAAPDALGADGAISGGVASLDGRCHVLPDRPLPALSTSSAKAFVATDRGDPGQQLYALIADPHLPFRLNAVPAALGSCRVSFRFLCLWRQTAFPAPRGQPANSDLPPTLGTSLASACGSTGPLHMG